MSAVSIGVLGRAGRALVGRAGDVTVADGWRVEWWVGGDDHWHTPMTSPTVRQRLVNATPVIETSLRVPGGDVVHRVGGVVLGPADAALVEVENRASIPVALGLALIAPDARGARPVLDGCVVRVDGRAFVRFASPPRRVALGDPARGEMVSLFVLPLTHTATARLALRLGGCGGVDLLDPGAAPPLDAVEKGWRALARRGAQIDLGDSALSEATDAARCFLLLHHGRLVAAGRKADKVEAGAVADGLSRLGFDHEAGDLRLSARLRPSRRGLPLVDPGRAAVPLPAPGRSDPMEVTAPATASAFVAALVGAALRDDGDNIDVLPSADASWRGRNVEVNDLPIGAGRVSFALRWHGARPALLWKVDARATIALRASSLDPAWTSSEAAGECLLQEPPPR